MRLSLHHIVIGCMICITCFLGCDRFQGSSQETKNTSPSQETTSSEKAEPDGQAMLGTEGSSETLVSKGITNPTARLAGFSLKEKLPLIYALIGDDEALRNEIEAYGRRSVGIGITTEADILEVMKTRKDKIIPSLDPLLNGMDEKTFFDQTEALSNELQSIGLEVATVEGMYGALVASPMLEKEMTVLGSDPFKLYTAFLNAEGASIGGEYPYSDMEPFRKMVLIGEELMTKYADSEYYSKIEKRFRRALDAFTGIYLQKQGSYTLPMIGGPVNHNEFGLTETETHKMFVKENGASRYHSVISEMMEDLSESSPNPETLYLITVAWVDSETQADSLRYQYLDAGKGILHQLKIQLGDGSQRYALVYRFYENDKKANTAFDRIEPNEKDVQLLMVSNNKGRLYQLGI